ncbi:hypothetical protein CROQUDRAFT_671714 [Cronartium quercuum f. sp. fusiforme G11]|uniref:Uncharacterized protein n=1 Tax=Cronartium quercuum f. sp. fusiforme G11 TaxID=708437 RepID=A0A9P6TAS5_9BASI|nr:hypothetical protein CROQUDRAFT_671714 [Cronartium quercuum f. sp. fusiforme G11]
MTLPSSSLVTLADRVLIPAVSLTELPDLTIEPLKVQELVLDYLSEQDCPAAVGHLQRELGKSSRRPQNNHATSRLVQLVAKGLIYEKNVPRLDSILRGCNDIMKSLESDSPTFQSTAVPHQLTAGSSTTGQHSSHHNINPDSQPLSQPRKQSLQHPQPRHPPNFQSHSIHGLEESRSDSTRTDQGQQPTTQFERPSLSESCAFNILLPPFPAPPNLPGISLSAGAEPGIQTNRDTQDRLFATISNIQPHSDRKKSTSSYNDAQTDTLVPSQSLEPTSLGSLPHFSNHHALYNVTAKPLDKTSWSSAVQPEQRTESSASPFPTQTSMRPWLGPGQTSTQVPGFASSSQRPAPLIFQTGATGKWRSIGNTDDIMCLSPERRLTAGAPHIIGTGDDEEHDIKPDIRHHHKQNSWASADGTLPLSTPCRGSTKRNGQSQVDRVSPPPKKSRTNGLREDTTRQELQAKGCLTSQFPLTLQTNPMLYGLSDADLPGTPPETSPHVGWRTVSGESARSDRELLNSVDRNSLTMVLEDEPLKDLSEVGTPRGSPPDTRIALADSNQGHEPQSLAHGFGQSLAVVTGNQVKDLTVNTDMASPFNSPPEEHTHPTTTPSDQALQPSTNELTSNCQDSKSNLALDPLTTPPIAIMEELRAKLLASRKPRSITASEVTSAPEVSPAPVPTPASGSSAHPTEPSHPVSLSLEQNLRAQLKSRRAVSPANPSHAGTNDELEDGQIATPPPEEEPKRFKVTMPTIKHPLPLKPMFSSMSLNNGFQLNPNPKPFIPPSLPLLSIRPAVKSPPPAKSSAPIVWPVKTSSSVETPVNSSTHLISGQGSLSPATVIPAEVTQTTSFMAKESDSVQQLRALKEREADLAAELARKRALLKARHQLQRSTSSFGSVDKSALSVSTLNSSGVSTSPNPPKSPVFDGAKRHDRASAADTFNTPEMEQAVGISPSTDDPASAECPSITCAPKFVEDFLTSLQQQLGGQSGSVGNSASQTDPLRSSSVPCASMVDRQCDGTSSRFNGLVSTLDPPLSVCDEQQTPQPHTAVSSANTLADTLPKQNALQTDESQSSLSLPSLDDLACHLQASQSPTIYDSSSTRNVERSQPRSASLDGHSQPTTSLTPSFNAFMLANKTKTQEVEGTASSPAESFVSSAESSVEIYLDENAEEQASLEAHVSDSTCNSRDERSVATQEYLSIHHKPSRLLSEHAICKAGNHCKDNKCILAHCSPAAQHGAPAVMYSSLCYHASDCRDSCELLNRSVLCEGRGCWRHSLQTFRCF